MQQGITLGHAMHLRSPKEHVTQFLRKSVRLSVIVFNEMNRTRAFTIAAALAFYFLWSLVPLIVLLSSLLKFLPISNLYQQLLNMMAELVPAYAMNFVEQVMIGILKTESPRDSFAIVVLGADQVCGHRSGNRLWLFR